MNHAQLETIIRTFVEVHPVDEKATDGVVVLRYTPDGVGAFVLEAVDLLNFPLVATRVAIRQDDGGLHVRTVVINDSMSDVCLVEQRIKALTLVKEFWTTLEMLRPAGVRR